MASKRAVVPARHLFNAFARNHLVRGMATEVPPPNTTLSPTDAETHVHSVQSAPSIQQQGQQNDRPNPQLPSTRRKVPQDYQPPVNPFLSTATCITHTFPSMTPTSFVNYPSTHLLLPPRKDVLHRAVIYEGDMTRQGTASTKWRGDVHGSNRKIRPQKGTGMARLGDKKSPMLKGGGVAFGPKPRDFSTRLPQKLYDLAWRTALSYRYSRGELVVLEDLADFDVHPDSRERYLRDLLRYNRMGHADGRTLFVTLARREALFGALEGENMGREARARALPEVDVKDLLELGRVVIERLALHRMLRQHETDLGPQQRLLAWQRQMGQNHIVTETGTGTVKLPASL